VEETMTEEQKPEKPEGSIVDELTTLGKQAADALKAAWDSPERKRLQAELTEGLEQFGRQVGAALDKASESAQAKELRTKAVKVADDVKVTDAVDEVRKGLLTGLEAMNRELSKVLERLEAERTASPVEAGATTPATPVGEAPVVGQPPAAADVPPTEEPPAQV
jgi:hypothetical protein